MTEIKTKFTAGEIVGKGDIASVLTPRDGFCFFASGVSNSKEERVSEYEREINLLLGQSRDKRIVYFSSLSICSEFYKETPYIFHKKQMETIVKEYFPKYCIVRIGNITWGKNPHTLINFMRNAAKDGKLEIQDTYRYLVDKEEFLEALREIPEYNCEINIYGKKMKVSEIVEKYVNGR